MLTVSDTRTLATDGSGALIVELLTKAGHSCVAREIVPDEPEVVRERTRHYCEVSGCLAVLITGGTGLAARDTTCEAVAGLFEKTMDGFGELFRMLSYGEIGAAAMLSRATAGVCCGTIVFALPGSTGAVRLAVEKLVLPQLGHIAGLLRKGG